MMPAAGWSRHYIGVSRRAMRGHLNEVDDLQGQVCGTLEFFVLQTHCAALQLFPEHNFIVARSPEIADAGLF